MLYLIAVLATALVVCVAGLLRARRATRAEQRYRRLEQLTAYHELRATEQHLAGHLVVAEAENVIYRALARELGAGGDDA